MGLFNKFSKKNKIPPQILNDKPEENKNLIKLIYETDENTKEIEVEFGEIVEKFGKVLREANIKQINTSKEFMNFYVNEKKVLLEMTGRNNRDNTVEHYKNIAEGKGRYGGENFQQNYKKLCDFFSVENDGFASIDGIVYLGALVLSKEKEKLVLKCDKDFLQTIGLNNRKEKMGLGSIVPPAQGYCPQTDNETPKIEEIQK